MHVVAAVAGLAAVLAVARMPGYLHFHTPAELLSIVVAFAILAA